MERLREVVENGILFELRYLVEEKGINPHQADEWALRRAAELGHLPIVQYLVERGSDLHILDDAALRRAAATGQLPVVDYLLQEGARINKSVLYQAAVQGHIHILRYFVRHGANLSLILDDALCRVVLTGDVAMVRYLVEQGAKDLECPLKLAEEYPIKEEIINYLRFRITQRDQPVEWSGQHLARLFR